MQWIEPLHSKSRVRAAGRRIREGTATLEDIEVLENHRASHAYIMNTFKANLWRRSKKKPIVVAQRLKRRRTIYDKLRREPTMQLSNMHDIAGARVIFQTIEELREFRASLHTAKFNHVLRNKNDDRYDYINNPKETGYRGIHDVYEYKVKSAQGIKWNGLLIEIQFRTRLQHAWATAVEVADFINTSRIKFDQADIHHKRYFQLTSEMMARAHEQQKSCLPDLSDIELVQEFDKTDKRIGLTTAFRNLQKAQTEVKFRTNTLLIFDLQKAVEKSPLRVETFDSVKRAISRYEVLEKELSGSADIVLVRADTPEAIRDAFRNYYSDVNDFLNYLDGARAQMMPEENLSFV